MNLIFCTVRLEDFTMLCRDKLYLHTLSNKIKFNFLIILFAKTSSSKSLPSPGTESQIERMTVFKKFGLQPYTLELTKSKVPVAYGGNSLSYLTRSNDVATNGVNGRIGNKTRCKCECCDPMETSIEGVCYLEILEICMPKFSSTSCLSICRSDSHFVL